MSNNSKITVTPADVAKQAEDEKFTTEVPAQKTGKDHPKSDSTDKTTGEKAKEVVEETAEAAKKTVKDRVTGLIEAAKNNKKFFYGVVTGALSTAVVLAIAAKDKVEEVVAELEIADDADPENEGDVTDGETSV